MDTLFSYISAKILRTLAAVGVLLAAAASARGEARWTMSLDLKGNHVEGYPLFASQQQIQLLSRDGQLLAFPTDEAKNARKASSSFRSYSSGEMRAALSRELGPSFEVSGTGHYLVAHPRGQRDLWASRFEDLYRSFVHYFSRRGIAVSDPEFPLVAIVWPKQSDFMRYAEQTEAKIAANVLGYYSSRTNRITLYDASGSGAGDAWKQNADVIIHEATHQTAHNTGLHRRFADNPRWLVEGLATMFEARGVWNSRDYQNQPDRINRGRLARFRLLEQKGKAGSLAELIGSDRLFEQDVDRAYAQAWALTFFLCETQSQRYDEYLKLVAKRAAFEKYSSTQRLKDFTKVFGELPLVESHFLRFMKELKTP
ncbi:MAG TPA: DUF1570 domain-containing protein [Pirellulales bacterium]|jgi:hypothetical protein|nr:DUF1570 domain-containing protein [Pirellulales bacterium]